MPSTKRHWRILMALFCCVCLALAPTLAEARAGSSWGGHSSSFGSRGVRSWDRNGAQPLGRSLAPQSPSRSGSGMPPYGGSFVQRHPFLTGLAGGVIGSWLFGHAAYAAGGGGAAGTLIWLLIIGFLIWFAVRRFRSRAGSGGWPRPGPGLMARSAGAAATAGGFPAGFHGRDVNLGDADLAAFQQLHAAVQAAWSAGDLARLRQLTTSEMLGYFSEELSRNTSRGLRNLVSNVELLSGELSEAWEEGDRQYATAVLHWRATDYAVRLGAAPGDPNAVIGGDPRVPVEAEEVWTFVRRRGGPWLLSAIQQV